jgi:hypothetical protein
MRILKKGSFIGFPYVTVINLKVTEGVWYMETRQGAHAGARVLYGVPITDAIASGDVQRMTAMHEEAMAHYAATADVVRLLPELERAIQAKGGVIRPLYAVTIQDAMARGDAAEIARLKAQVDVYQGMLASSATHTNVVPPYGIAIQEAKARGDEAEVRRLTAQAESLLAQLNATK